MPFLGGFDITDIGWAGAAAVYVDLDHGGTYTSRLFQLYAGRRLIGVTRAPTARYAQIIGQVPTGGAASPLSVLVVEESERDTNFGHIFTRKPYSVYRATWLDPGNPDGDLHHFDVVAGANPGEAYDADNVVARVPYFAGQASYSIDLPPLPDSGEWSIAVIARDNTQPLGNAGTPQDATITALVYPPALVARGDGRPFGISIANGVLTVDYDCGTPATYP